MRVRFLIVMAALAFATTVWAQRPAAPVSPDAYGYRMVDQSDSDCSYDFVDLRGTGTPLSLTASGADPAQDDGGALLALAAPFQFYGQAVAQIVVSANGYLAISDSLAVEDGGDFSNDATLPAIPGNLHAAPSRLMPYHDELSGHDSGGTIYSEFFGNCPRPSESLGAEPCTVIHWSDWGLAGVSDPFELQALLYHDSWQVVYQVAPQAATLVGGTIGIQDARARSALQYGGVSVSLTAPTAVCIFEPRFPAEGPSADLEVTIDDAVEVVASGQSVTYEIGVLNRGPSPVDSVSVTNDLSALLVNCNWSCVAAENSNCTSAGSGPIVDTLQLASNGWADYVMQCDVAPNPGEVVNTVTAQAAAVVDAIPINNSASDIDTDGIPDFAGPLLFDNPIDRNEISWPAQAGASAYELSSSPFVDFSSPCALSSVGVTNYVDSAPLASGQIRFFVVRVAMPYFGSWGRDSQGMNRTLICPTP